MWNDGKVDKWFCNFLFNNMSLPIFSPIGRKQCSQVENSTTQYYFFSLSIPTNGKSLFFFLFISFLRFLSSPFFFSYIPFSPFSPLPNIKNFFFSLRYIWLSQTRTSLRVVTNRANIWMRLCKTSGTSPLCESEKIYSRNMY